MVVAAWASWSYLYVETFNRESMKWERSDLEGQPSVRWPHLSEIARLRVLVGGYLR